MTDIAQRAGVSRAAVSFVLNGRQRADGSISEETRQRILQAAEDLGYRRNEMARAVVTGRSRIIGFLTPAPDSDAVMRILISAAQEAEQHGYSLKVMPLSSEEAVEDSVITRCQEFRLSGVLVVFLQAQALAHLREELARFRIPLATADDQEPQNAGAQIFTDYKSGMEAAVAHLAAMGHRKISFFAVRPGYHVGSQAREQAFRHAMKTHGLKGTIVQSGWQTAKSERAAEQMLRKFSRPTAVITATDSYALILSRVARRIGFTLPRDLSVIGCGDLPIAELGDPPLTTLRQPFYEMGAEAVRLLIERSESDDRELPFSDAPQRILLPAPLVVRDSTAPPPDQD